MNTPSFQPFSTEYKRSTMPFVDRVSGVVSDIISLDNCAILNAFEESNSGHFTAKSANKSHVMK